MKRLAVLLALLWAGTAQAQCPTGYSLVYNSNTYQTGNFCVAKYEMKNVGGVATSQAAGLPWVSIPMSGARTACTALGTTYHLITNSEWMTVARDIENTAGNWSGSAVGSGLLNRGHSDGTPDNMLEANADDNQACNGTGQTCSSTVWDEQRRTHVLSTGEVVWDLSGNANEWSDWVVDPNDKASPGTSYIEINASVPTTAMPAWRYWPTNASFTKVHGVGAYFGAEAGVGGYPFRGGRWANTTNAGIFSINLGGSAATSNTTIGFRCVTSLQTLTRAYMTETY